MENENVLGLQTVREPHAIGLSLLVDPKNPTLDIVFVHGFTGHPQRTWTHKQGTPDERYGHDDGERPNKVQKLFSSTSPHDKRNGVPKAVYWPRDLIPITAPNARVLTYGYDSRIRHVLGPAVSKSTVYDIAWDFLVSLETTRRSEQSRPLLFIAHSLGGIIVKEALRRSRGCETYQDHLHGIYKSTSGIFFFGTPHGGADPRGLIHHIAEKLFKAVGFSANEQIINTLLPTSERLRELREEFGPMAHQNDWIIYSLQEQYGVKALNGSKVVDDTASCLNNPAIEVTQHIANNHMEMCRFSGLDDVEYGKVVGALNRIIEATARLAPSKMRFSLSLDQRRSYLDSLRFEQIDARHATIKKAHAKTCTWLLNKSEYQDWLDRDKILEHHGFLWIKGKPATGKSTIMKFICEHAKKNIPQTLIVSFFFNARGEHIEKSVLGMYRSLLFQLLEKFSELQCVFEIVGPTAPNIGDFDTWNVEMVKTLFGHAIEKLGQRRLTCFIDALDECEEDQVRDMVTFFEDLGQLAVSSQSRFLVCFSSRHYPHITINKSVQLTLEGQDGHQQDIRNYLQSELKAGRSKLIEQIKDDILNRASGIFLWVVLVVQMLNKEYDRGRIHALQKRLNEIPNGLDELFKDILVRDGKNIEEMILCLQWILYAKRPLKREELYYAILAGVEPETLTPWSTEEITKQDMERFLLNSSKGLAEVTKSKDQTVQFIHESVRDFFLKGSGLHRLRSDLGSNFPGLSHERLKQCCQNYLRVDFSKHLPLSQPLPSASSEEASSIRRLAFETFPFLGYAVRNVLHHADAADRDGISQDGFVEHFPLGDWITLNNAFERYQIRRYTSDGSLLYILAEENLPNLIRIELRRVPHMDIKGERYRSPILAALAHANESAVRALLIPYTDVSSDSAIPYHHPFYSTDMDHQVVIKSLLKHENVISPRKDQILLSWAAENGDIALVKVLLATWKVDINSRAKHGWTPLLGATTAGHEDIVRLLLISGKVYIDAQKNVGLTPQLITRNDVEINSRDSNGQTALLRAVLGGHEAVIKLLVAHNDVDINSGDNSGQTALVLAAKRGYKAAVELLLARNDVNINLKDNSKQTALSLAAVEGHEPVVKLLLARSDDNINSKNNKGRTALSLAAVEGHEAVVKLLLARSDVNINSIDNKGNTALSLAAVEGREAVVKLLLAHKDIHINLRDDSRKQTALFLAAQKGHEAVVELLLARNDIDIDPGLINKQTALFSAAANGHKAVVKLLLACKDIDINSEDSFGQTALFLAATRGQEAVIKLLLAHKDIDINLGDIYRQTALSIAAEGGYEAVVKLLLAHKDIRINLVDNDGRTALWLAAKGGHETTVKLLLAHKDIDINSRNINGKTALSMAAEGGHETTVKLLLAHKDIDINSRNTNRKTALSMAAEGRHEAVVKLLLAHKDIDINLVDRNGHTALIYAVVGGHEAVVKLLLTHKDIDINSVDENGHTALRWAIARGYEAVVKLLQMHVCSSGTDPPPHPPL